MKTTILQKAAGLLTAMTLTIATQAKAELKCFIYEAGSSPTSFDKLVAMESVADQQPYKLIYANKGLAFQVMSENGNPTLSMAKISDHGNLVNIYSLLQKPNLSILVNSVTEDTLGVVREGTQVFGFISPFENSSRSSKLKAMKPLSTEPQVIAENGGRQIISYQSSAENVSISDVSYNKTTVSLNRFQTENQVTTFVLDMERQYSFGCTSQK